MGGAGYQAFKESGHYKVGCTGCHNGKDNTSDKVKAHGADFISHPSASYETKCAACHQQISANFKNSIHNGFGQKRKVTMRSGLSGPDEFDKLPAHQIEGYTNNCATCHGTCGNCHVVRPALGGGGLANGHAFTRKPDMVSTCVTCHSSRGGHAYMGVASGTQPDVHLKKAGFKCMDCHTGGELHGSNERAIQRYAYKELPTCDKCHAGKQNSNMYHSVHYSDFNCQVCHSQNYNNCGSCHVHGEGARIPSYLDYKIALNPIPDIKTGFKFSLVRRTLAAPDNWERFGVSEYANFDIFPTYNYTTPHNILRWTDRTRVAEGASCSANCHIRNEAGTLVNKKNFLFQENLLDWEKGATTRIAVDGKLPASWFK
jgi:thiosulfate/3-mercaptopyruvate sulfurtransferase